MSKLQLDSGLVTDFRPAGSGGVEVHTQAERLRAVLREQIGETAANTLSMPVLDDRGSKIDWYTLLVGRQRNWVELAESERKQVSRDIGKLAAQVAGLAERLSQDSSSPHHLLARHLALALRIPANTHCFLVGDHPVLTFWGFDPLEDATPPPAEVIRAWCTPTATVVPPPLDAAPDPTRRPESPATRSTDPAPGQAPPVRGSRSSIPWWSWLLLLLALLLSSAWFLHRYRSHAPPFETSGQRDDHPLSNRPRVEPETPPPPEPLAERKRPLPPLPGEVEMLTDPPSEPLGEAARPVIESHQEVPAVAVPEPLEPPGETALTEQDATIPEVGAVLVIPPEALTSGSVDFLNGLWRAETALLDADTQMPVELEYAITDGAGELRVIRHDGGHCRAPVTTRIDAGELIVEGPEPIQCNDGAVFGRPQLRCHTDSDGRTECTGQNPDDSRFHVQLRRAGGPGATRARAAARPGPNLAAP